ncbi:hypothetical protein GGI23_006270, partial [Coemansia sp. RSA 2559]
MAAKDQLVSSDIAVSRDWLERSYQVALSLDRRGEWPSYLSSTELPWLKRALASQSLWSRFISPQPEQWRVHAPPPPIFELEPSKTQTSPKQEPASAKTPTSSTSHGRSDVHPTKRTAPQTDSADSQDEGKLGKPDKRARTNSVSADSDEDMLSVLSGSDIDMAMWSREGSIALGTGSPVSGAAMSAAKKAQGTSVSNSVAAAESTITCALAAFHVRSAIFEQYLSVLYGTGDCTRCTNTSAALEGLVDVESQLSGSSAAKAATVSNPSGASASQATLLNKAEVPMPLISRGLDEDEDYDDDEGEDEVEEKVGGDYSNCKDANGDTSIFKDPSEEQISKADGVSSGTSAENPCIDKQISGSLDQVTIQLEQGLGISVPDQST